MNEVDMVFNDVRAKWLLKRWCKEHEVSLVKFYDCTEFLYGASPFWAITALLWSWRTAYNGRYGFQIYENGKIITIKQDT